MEGGFVTSMTGVSLPASLIGVDSSTFSRTSRFILDHGEYFVTCPYDVSHCVTNLRMDRHLLKCRQNYIWDRKTLGKDVDYVACPYGICKAIPRPELEFHQERCSPGRTSYFRHVKVNPGTTVKGKTMTEKKKEIAGPSEPEACTSKSRQLIDTKEMTADDEEEDWEKDAYDGYISGYEPAIKLIRENILIAPKGVTKAEKRIFKLITKRRAEERMASASEVQQVPEQQNQQ